MVYLYPQLLHPAGAAVTKMVDMEQTPSLYSKDIVPSALFCLFLLDLQSKFFFSVVSVIAFFRVNLGVTAAVCF